MLDDTDFTPERCSSGSSGGDCGIGTGVGERANNAAQAVRSKAERPVEREGPKTMSLEPNESWQWLGRAGGVCVAILQRWRPHAKPRPAPAPGQQ
jgi:hypothetical protein